MSRKVEERIGADIKSAITNHGCGSSPRAWGTSPPQTLEREV